MAIKPLSDLDGALTRGTKGTLIVGDGIATLADGFYIAKAVAETSGLPTGVVVGTPFFGDSTITPAVGDDVLPFTFEKLCDVQSATIDLAADELEVTTLCDEVKKYIKGRTDLTGSLTGITKLGITDQDGWVINNFVKKIVQSDDLSTVTISEVDGGTIYLQLEINKKSTDGEPEAFYLMPVTLTSVSQGVPIGSAQTFESAFRVTDDEDVEFVLFELEQPVV